MSKQLLTTINGRIEKLAASERVTKAELSALSREVLDYIRQPDCWDAQVINRLLVVLTPMNQKTAVLFFKAHTPFAFNEETHTFSGIKNKKAKASSLEAIEMFLASGQDIWDWAQSNITVEKKKPNYMVLITKNVKGALESHESRNEVLKAVFAGGVTSEDVMNMLAQMEAEAQTAIKAA